MVKGRKLPTPLDPEEREIYQTKRAKNNKAAEKHREKTRQSLAEAERLKEKCYQLAVDLEQEKKRRVEVENENRRLLNLLLTHDCISSPEHREQLYNTFCPSSVSRNSSSEVSSSPMSLGRSANTPLSQYFHMSPQQQPYQMNYRLSDSLSNCSTRNSTIPFSDSSYSPLSNLSSPYQPQMDARPVNFWLDNFTAREEPPTSSTSDQSVKYDVTKYATFDEFMKAKTGHTPLPGQKMCTPLADLMDIPKKAGTSSVSNPADAAPVSIQSDASWDALIDQELSPGRVDALPVLTGVFSRLMSPCDESE
ncbi:hypothetical protein PENTCL1PPCAC_21325 [Pristionchus entomophagus]|uniref:BZIP domain-containing protein n=1 Tax=Pristionchus entomophagus TaxID=358040 RepID=A0AAV5TY22_9BILA|nr:hypothetical protein PENTCL1PPCAC_21325 [Pristionchus entomophagus]